jgi:hypothetical protein
MFKLPFAAPKTKSMEYSLILILVLNAASAPAVSH